MLSVIELDLQEMALNNLDIPERLYITVPEIYYILNLDLIINSPWQENLIDEKDYYSERR